MYPKPYILYIYIHSILETPIFSHGFFYHLKNSFHPSAFAAPLRSAAGRTWEWNDPCRSPRALPRSSSSRGHGRHPPRDNPLTTTWTLPWHAGTVARGVGPNGSTVYGKNKHNTKKKSDDLAKGNEMYMVVKRKCAFEINTNLQKWFNEKTHTCQFSGFNQQTQLTNKSRVQQWSTKTTLQIHPKQICLRWFIYILV